MAEPRVRRKSKLTVAAVIAVLCCALAAWAGTVAWVQDLENRTWDWRLRFIAPFQPADPDIKIILIDQSSLEHFASNDAVTWPWFREMYAAVVQFLAVGGARGLAFDMLFTEPSSYGVDDDAALALGLRSSMPVILAAALRESRREQEGKRLMALSARNGTNAAFSPRRFGLEKESLHRFGSVLLPLPEFLDAAKGIGNVSATPDRDGVFRRVRPAGVVNDESVLSLPFALFAAAHAAPVYGPEIGTKLARDGKLVVRFRGGPGSYETYPIDSIIVSQRQLENGEQPLVLPTEFQNSYVFLGMNAPGLLDLRPTPLSALTPGVEFNATVLDNLIHDSFVREVTPLWNFLATAALVIACVSLSLFVPSGMLQFILILTTLFLYVATAALCAVLGWWLALFTPLGAGFLATLGLTAYQYSVEGRERRFLRGAFQQYVSPGVIDRILEDPDALSLGGERRELTIFFSDIAGFTSISEKLEPEALGRLLNRFLSEMTAVLMQEGGTVDKYVGDAIVAFWNAPLPVPQHAERGVRAAQACQQRIREIAPELRREFGVDISMRIGLHTGVVSVGNFGSDSRFNYTVIGDAANLASRLEGANKHFGTQVLVSESTYRALEHAIPCRRIAAVQVVGKSEAVSIYEPLPPSSAERAQSMEDALVKLERNDLDGARAAFERMLPDPVAERYLTRMRDDPSAGTLWILTEK